MMRGRPLGSTASDLHPGTWSTLSASFSKGVDDGDEAVQDIGAEYRHPPRSRKAVRALLYRRMSGVTLGADPS
jgi:hypothetical protein